MQQRNLVRRRWENSAALHTFGRYYSSSWLPTFIFASSMNNITINAWCKFQQIICQSCGVMQQRNLVRRRWENSAALHTFGWYYSSYWLPTFIFASSMNNITINEWCKFQQIICQSWRVMQQWNLGIGSWWGDEKNANLGPLSDTWQPLEVNLYRLYNTSTSWAIIFIFTWHIFLTGYCYYLHINKSKYWLQ